MLHIVESQTQSVSSYVDLMKKVVLLIGDKNSSTCKLAARVLVAVGNKTWVFAWCEKLFTNQFSFVCRNGSSLYVESSVIEQNSWLVARHVTSQYRWPTFSKLLRKIL